MSARLVRGFTVLVFAAVLCLVGSTAFAEEMPLPVSDSATQMDEAPSFEPLSPASQDLSQYYTPAQIDELEELFGEKPILMCGVHCDYYIYPPVSCFRACGVAAQCYFGYCVYS